MNKSFVISGGSGPERTEFVKKYLDSAVNDGEVIIYDYTYGLSTYAEKENVSYFCVDTCSAYIDKLTELLERKNFGDKTPVYIVTDAYGGLMFQGNMKALFVPILENKNEFSISVLMSCRHLEYVPERLVSLFDDVIKYEDINGVLSNDYFKNLGR
ncbi:MAG: hypothetical protein MJ068_02580 [Clostridia bacterium]|nr:hypothetical protein [Clostridia bacterium]